MRRFLNWINTPVQIETTRGKQWMGVAIFLQWIVFLTTSVIRGL